MKNLTLLPTLFAFVCIAPICGSEQEPLTQEQLKQKIQTLEQEYAHKRCSELGTEKDQPCIELAEQLHLLHQLLTIEVRMSAAEAKQKQLEDRTNTLFYRYFGSNQ